MGLDPIRQINRRDFIATTCGASVLVAAILHGASDRRSAALQEASRLAEELATRQAERKLHAFVKQAWHMVEPQRAFRDGWHIGAVCEHLEAVKAGQIKLLVINQPPATMKSLVVCVFFPAWCWTQAPWMRLLFLSYDQSLSTRDNLRMRNLVESQWYRDRWALQLSADQNQKTRYDTTAGGWRIGTSIGGRIIGEHPHGKVVDDPHNPRKQLLSELELKQATDMWDYGLAARGATLDAWTVLLMQRLHENDLSGHVLTQEPDAVHLCLPMRYEPPTLIDLGGVKEPRSRMKTTPIGWNDPRTTDGELLWPAEWTEAKVAATEHTLGSWGTSGQLQQRPAPAGGLMFQRAWFGTIQAMPSDVLCTVRFWDVAGTEGGTGPRTAGVKMSRTASGKFIISDIAKGRWSEADVDRMLKQTAAIDGQCVAVREEEEGGSAGPAVIKARKRAMVGYDYRGVRPVNDKVTRARPLRAQAEVGNVVLLSLDGATPSWIREFLDEIEVFPAGVLKDQVDAATGAFNTLAGVVQDDLDLTTGELMPDSELTEHERADRDAAQKQAAARAVTDEIARTGAYWPTGGTR